MSRVGRKPVPIPQGVQVTVEGNVVRVKGPKGQLERTVPHGLTVAVEDGAVVVRRQDDERRHRALHGLFRTLIANMITGVTQGYEKSLTLEGAGYRANKQGRKLVLSLGYSHPVEYVPPDGIDIEVPAANTVIVRGIDKELVGNVAATIRAKRPLSRFRYADGPRGIRYTDERVSLRPAKTGK
ncbi:MAG: 50S ribosomal protein L6 [Bacillota bacterium]|nr:MAG: 50S ribosomal protein L6 [Bacillota bacterium]